MAEIIVWHIGAESFIGVKFWYLVTEEACTICRRKDVPTHNPWYENLIGWMFFRLAKQQSFGTTNDPFESLWAAIQWSGTSLCHSCNSFNFSSQIFRFYSQTVALWIQKLSTSLFPVSSSLTKICSPTCQQLPHMSEQNLLPVCCRRCSWSKSCQWGNLV